MKPSDRLRILGARSFTTTTSVPHLAPFGTPIAVPQRANDPAGPTEPVYRVDLPDRSPGREVETLGDGSLPNPFLTPDPESARPVLVPVRESPTPETGMDGVARGPSTDDAGPSPRISAAPQMAADGPAEAEDRALVPSIAYLPPVADGRDTAHRSGDAPDAIAPACPPPETGPQPDRPAGAAWSRAPKLRLTPAMTAAESFRIIVLASLSHLVANHECARLNLHIEGVHQCRIALRRLRSAFKTYGPVLRREQIEPIDQAVGWIGQTLGVARDLDVLQTGLVAPAAEAFGPSGELAAVMTKLEAQQAIAYAAVRQALASARYDRLVADLRALGADQLGAAREVCTSPDQPVTDIALPALTTAHRKLLKRGKRFETLSEAERHEVRIALKRLRYSLDFFAALFNGGSKRKFMKRVACLQDDLGHLNDVAAAKRTLAGLVGLAADGSEPAAPDLALGTLAFAAGGILGWHRREAAQANRRLVKDWYAFVQSTPFWSR